MIRTYGRLPSKARSAKEGQLCRPEDEFINNKEIGMVFPDFQLFQLKTNTALQMESAKIEFRVI
jgi:hypothetical protein